MLKLAHMGIHPRRNVFSVTEHHDGIQTFGAG